MTMTLEEFLTQLARLGIASRDEVQTVLEQALSSDANSVVRSAAQALVRVGKLTEFQAQALLEGKLVSIGPYLFEEKLADGGMGQVFLARHRAMGRRVAVKLIHEKQVGSQRAAARFQREIQALASLQHPNIVTAFDAGEEQGVAYLAMEYIEGRNLAQEVKLRGKLPVNAALEYVRQAAIGLQYIHQEGIIHRDIKPSNLFLERSGTIKILDLGLSRWADWRDRPDPHTTVDVTADGEVVGTFDFMAPEQFASLHEVDQRSDLFSLGCTLYFLLHGKPPYAGASAGEKLLARREQPMPMLSEGRPDVGPDLEHIFQRLVARDPHERYGHAQQLLKALRGIQDKAFDVGETVALGGAGTTAPVVRPTGDARRGRWLAGGALCAALAGVAFWLTRDRDEPRAPLPPTPPVAPQQLAEGDPQPTPADQDPQPVDTQPAEPSIPPAEAPPETIPPQTPAAETPAVETPSPATPGSDAPAPTGSAEAAAAWVLAVGGTVDVAHETGFLSGLAATAELPAPPFSLVRVNLSGSMLPAGELSALADLPDLIWLDLSRSNVRSDDLAALSRLPRLQTLSLNASTVGDDGLAHLAALPALGHLDLRGTPVTDEGLGRLAACPALTTLLLGEGQALTDRGLEQLRPLKTLTNLGLRGTNVSNAGLAYLLELQSLVWLDLGGVNVDDAGLAVLQALNLRTLYLDGTQVTEQGAALFTAKNCEVIR